MICIAPACHGQNYPVLSIRIDGEEVADHCAFADDEAGYVLLMTVLRGANGRRHYAVDEDRALIYHSRQGKVVITPRELPVWPEDPRLNPEENNRA